ncbi:MAG: hypothetical protein AB1411_09865 [Nitrospirota bacterium]|jgi:hypothetical protein
MARQAPPSGPPPEGQPGNGGPAPEGRAREIELLKVVVTRNGQQVSAQWAIHPLMKRDLLPQEWQELSELMAKATGLVGSRFAQVLAEAEPDRPGTA